MAAPEPFPEEAQHLVPDSLILESLGWQRGTYGALSLLLGTALFYSQSKAGKPDVSLVVGACACVIGVALVYWELHARRNPTGICVREPKLGIYRGGRLDMEVTRREITLYQTNILNTIKLSLLPAMIMFLGMIPYIGKGEHPGLLEILCGVALAAVGSSSLASLIYTRHVWIVFRLPRKGRFAFNEDFCVTRSQASILNGAPL